METKFDPTVKSAEIWARSARWQCGICKISHIDGQELVAHLKQGHNMAKATHDLIYGKPKQKTFQCQVVRGDLTCPTATSHTYHNVVKHLEEYHQMSIHRYFKQYVLNFSRSNEGEKIDKKKKVDKQLEQIQLQINSNGEKRLVAETDLSNPQSLTEHKETVEQKIKNKNVDTNKQNLCGVAAQPTLRGRRKRVMGEVSEAQEDAKKPKNTRNEVNHLRIRNLTNTKDKSGDPENKTSEANISNQEGCLMQCTICQPPMKFDNVHALERHISTHHQLSMKKYMGQAGLQAFRQLKVTKCNHCHAVVLNDHSVIQQHNKSAHNL